MDNISMQGPEQHQTQNTEKKRVKTTIRVLIIVLVFLIGLVCKLMPSETSGSQNSNTQSVDVNQVEEYAKDAALAFYAFDEGISYQEHIENMCEISTASSCEQQPDAITEDLYNKFVSEKIRCEIVSSEYIDKYESDETTIYVYRINSKLFIEGNENFITNDDAVIMTDDDGWKIYTILDYDKYLEIVSED